LDVRCNPSARAFCHHWVFDYASHCIEKNGDQTSVVDEQTGPLGQEFGLMLREQRVGARLEDAMDNLGERVQSEELDLVITATMISQEVGGNLGEILQSLSETIRKKIEMAYFFNLVRLDFFSDYYCFGNHWWAYD